MFELRQSLMEHGTATDGQALGEWARATVVALHLFEAHVRRPDEDRAGHLALVHLNAAHHIFRESRKQGPPESVHDCMLHEAYIIRTSINCLYQSSISFPIDYVRQLVDQHENDLRAFGVIPSLRIRPWIGIIGTDMVDTMYRLSWLAHRVSLDESDSQKAADIAAWLELWQVPEVEGGGADEGAIEYARGTGRAYWHSCSLLCRLLRPYGSGYNDAEFLTHHKQEGMAVVDLLSRKHPMSLAVTSPRLVLSLTLDSEHELHHRKATLQRLADALGYEITLRVARMLDNLYDWAISRSGLPDMRGLMEFITSQNLFL
ncbi:hypothetical protein Slin14017_G055950 [Septoria linicola]|nr:hypothetical protein Slin14017_G055950 [Septoria linicola]